MQTEFYLGLSSSPVLNPLPSLGPPKKKKRRSHHKQQQQKKKPPDQLEPRGLPISYSISCSSPALPLSLSLGSRRTWLRTIGQAAERPRSVLYLEDCGRVAQRMRCVYFCIILLFFSKCVYNDDNIASVTNQMHSQFHLTHKLFAF